METKIESKLLKTLNCSSLKTKDTAKTLTIVANYIIIELKSNTNITIVDLLAKYNKSTGKLTINYEMPLLDYKEENVKKVSDSKKVDKTFVQDFNNKNKLIKSILQKTIVEAIDSV